MTQRRKLTSSERHGVIALAVVMALVVALMAVDRGVFTPKAADVASTVSSTPVRSDTSELSEPSELSSPPKSRRKKQNKKAPTAPSGRSRSHLDEPAR